MPHNLVKMTRKSTPPAATSTRPPQPPPGKWRLQDAKARFSELVRRARDEGPQQVTIHGRDAVVVVDAGVFRRLQDQRTGQQLIEALQASPHPAVEVAPRRGVMPVRDVAL